MPRFYFDHYDRDGPVRDEDGVECRNAELARNLAARALGEAAKDALPGADRCELSIEVLDEHRNPLFRTVLSYEVQLLG